MRILLNHFKSYLCILSFIAFLLLFTPVLTANEPATKPTNQEFKQKTAKLHMPFIANNCQVDEQVKFYAKTFGGTVFVTKEGEIVYALPHTAADASTLSHYDIDKNETGYTGLTGFLRKEGQCIVHRALCTMYP